MYRLALRPWFKRLIVAVMLGAFLPAVVAACACETTCAAISTVVGQLNEEHSHSEGTVHSEQEMPASDHAAHLKHGGVCNLASMICVAPAEAETLVGAHVDTWTQPVQDGFESFIWPPPTYPPRA
jgi:hypothetical protein